MTYPVNIDPAALIREVAARIGDQPGQINQAELARRVGHTPGSVSQILSSKPVAAGGRHQTRAKALLLAAAVGLVRIDPDVLKRVRIAAEDDDRGGAAEAG